jgi:uncharacterized protein
LVHIFIIKNMHIVFDVESGSIYIVDKMIYEIISEYILYQGKKPEISQLIKRLPYTENDIISACEEIESLIGSGSLFTPPHAIFESLFYPDQPRIKALCLLMTNECNLRCEYCFANAGDYNTGNKGNMSLETGMKSIDLLIQASGQRKNLDIDFFGGEPLINWDTVVALTHYCEKTGPKHGKNIRLTITTNAMLLDDDKIEFIEKHMSNCVLSLDGREEIHNRMRKLPCGKGSYEKITQNIKRFISKKTPNSYFIRGTFTRNNLDFSKDVLHIRSLGATSISIEPVVGPLDAAYTIKKRDLPVVFKEYERLAEEIILQEKKGNSFEFFHFNMDLNSGPCSYKRLKGCGVGTEYVAIAPNGDVYPCHQLTGEKKFLMGNVNNNSFDSLVSEDNRTLFAKLLVPRKMVCDLCWAKYYCSGGCPANAYFDTGNLLGQYEIGCVMQKKRLECALWIKALKHLNNEEEAIDHEYTNQRYF